MPARFHDLDQAGGAGVADLELALEAGGRALALHDEPADAGLEELVAAAVVVALVAAHAAGAGLGRDHRVDGFFLTRADT